jgi:tetratricopeptide (TPR) repeat protein
MKKSFLMVLFVFTVYGFSSANTLDLTSDNDIIVQLNQDFKPNKDTRQDLKLKKPEIYRLDTDIEIKKFSYKKQKAENEIINTKKADLSDDINKIINSNNISESLNLADTDSINIKELEQSNLETEENKQIAISLKSSGWIIKSVTPPLLKLVKRDNLNKNSVFTFEAGPPATVNIVFLRYDENTNTILRQPFLITIIPKKIFEIVSDQKPDKATTDNSNTLNINSQNQQANNKKETEEDYRKILANQLFDQKKYDEALKRYESLVKDKKADSEIYYKMAIIEKDVPDLAKATENFKMILKDKDSIYFVDALIELIKLLKDQGKFSDAVDIFYQYALTKKLDSKSGEELYILLSDIYYSMGDFNSASKEYRRFIQRFPNSIYYDKALFYLAYSLESLQYNPDFREAYRLYNLIIDNYPESKFYNLSKKRIINLDRHYLKIN